MMALHGTWRRMFGRRPRIAIACTLLFGLALAASQAAALGAPPEPVRPLRVIASAVSDTEAVVAWTPGTELADAYRIYGNNGGSLTLLAEVAIGEVGVFVRDVQGAFEGYAVSGVKDGEETVPTFSMANPNPQGPGYCVNIGVGVPPMLIIKPEYCPVLHRLPPPPDGTIVKVD